MTVNIKLKSILILNVVLFFSACASQPQRSDSSTAAEQNPPQINALISDSLSLAMRGSLTEAETMIRAAIAIDSKNVDANNVAGLIYATTNKPSLAASHYQKALEYAPNDASTLNNYGNFLCDTGRMNQAEQLFLRAGTNASNPNPEIAYTNAGLCSMRIPDQDKAATYFKTALDFKTENSIAYFHLAQINFNKKLGQPALQRLQAYAQYTTHTPQSLKLGIQIGRLLNDRQVENSYFQLLEQQFPNSAEYTWAVNS